MSQFKPLCRTSSGVALDILKEFGFPKLENELRMASPSTTVMVDLQSPSVG
jgi:hypothetical protein